MKKIIATILICSLAFHSKAKKEKLIGIGLNSTYHSNNTFRNKNSYVKGVPTIGYGVSVLYQQNLSDHLGFQASLNYIRHHATFKINVPLKDFSLEYTDRPNYSFKYTIPGYKNVDLAIGLFYTTNLKPKINITLSADITANYEVFWAKEISFRTYYQNPDPIRDSSQFISIYGTHGVSKRHRSLTDYLILLTPQYRLAASLDFHMNDHIKFYTNFGYERIVPFSGGEQGLFPKRFDFLNEDMKLIETTDYMNKFNMFRLQLGFKYRINSVRE